MGITLLGFWSTPYSEETYEENWRDTLQPLAAALCLKAVTDNLDPRFLLPLASLLF